MVRTVLCAATLGLLRFAEALETGTVSAGVNTFAVSFSGAYRDPVVIAVSRSLACAVPSSGRSSQQLRSAQP